MSVRVGEADHVPRLVSLFSPLLESLLARGVPLGPMGSSPSADGRAACLAPRRSRSSRSQAGGGSGLPGARSTGSAICARPVVRRSPCAAGKKKSLRPSWTRRLESRSSAKSSVLSPDPSEAAPPSFAWSMASISTTRWKRPGVVPSSGSTHVDEIGRRKHGLTSRAPSSVDRSARRRGLAIVDCVATPSSDPC